MHTLNEFASIPGYGAPGHLSEQSTVMRNKLQQSWVHQLETIRTGLHQLFYNHLKEGEERRGCSAKVLTNVSKCALGSTVYQNVWHVYLIHIWFDQHLSYKSLGISSLVYGGVCPQAVTHHVQIGCLQTLNQQALQRLLQHGGDPCDTLA